MVSKVPLQQKSLAVAVYDSQEEDNSPIHELYNLPVRLHFAMRMCCSVP